MPEGLRWIWSRTRLPVPFPTTQHAPWEKPRREIRKFSEKPPVLPEKSLLMKFVELYSNSALHRIFPVINPALFFQTIQAAYSHNQSPLPQYHSAQACIFGFMAMISSLHHLDPSYDPFELPTIPREVYIAHASAAIPAFIQGPLNLDDLQASIILVRQGHGPILNVPCAQLTKSTYNIGIHLCPRRRGTKSHSLYIHCFASFVSNWSSGRIG